MGPIRVDPEYPWHFLWEGTGEHYFFNGTTAFWLMGWRDERFITGSIERLHELKVNRLRVLLAGNMDNLLGEAVLTGANFSMALRPWVAKTPESFDQPGIDYKRFQVPYWQKFERMLRYARDRDVIISVVAGHLHAQGAIRRPEATMSGATCATLALAWGHSRISPGTWATISTRFEMKNGRINRNAAGGMGSYHHLATSHPVHREHQDRAADWFGFTSIQEWSRKQHALMLEERQIQKKTGRIIPQTNEEYGYEDHYPKWAPGMGSDSAEALRHVAWDIAMAGAYQTTGESARRGTNIWPDTGGGWINGRGDDTMVMLKATHTWSISSPVSTGGRRNRTTNW